MSKSESATTSRRKTTMRAAKKGSASPVRAKLLRQIKRAPGLPLSGHINGLGIGWNTLYREIEALEREGEVRLQKRGRHCLVFPAGSEVSGRRALDQTVMLQGVTARAIAALVEGGTATDMESIAKALDLSPRVVYYHLRRLVDAKLIESERTTRYTGLRPTKALGPLLKQIWRRDAAVGVA